MVLHIDSVMASEHYWMDASVLNTFLLSVPSTFGVIKGEEKLVSLIFLTRLEGLRTKTDLKLWSCFSFSIARPTRLLGAISQQWVVTLPRRNDSETGISDHAFKQMPAMKSSFFVNVATFYFSLHLQSTSRKVCFCVCVCVHLVVCIFTETQCRNNYRVDINEIWCKYILVVQVKEELIRVF